MIEFWNFISSVIIDLLFIRLLETEIGCFIISGSAQAGLSLVLSMTATEVLARPTDAAAARLYMIKLISIIA